MGYSPQQVALYDGICVLPFACYSVCVYELVFVCECATLIACYKDLPVAQTFEFYKTLYGMDDHQFIARRDFLLNLFDLPMRGVQLVKSLSSGEQRRLSLACT